MAVEAYDRAVDARNLEHNKEISVLVVDDDQVTREVICALLEGEGYTVASTFSAESALELLSRRSFVRLPDVILTDLQMPSLAGNDFARELRSLCGPLVQIVVMTAGDPEPSSIAAFDVFLKKPVQLDDFAQVARGLSIQPKWIRQDRLAMLSEAVYEKLAEAMGQQKTKELYQLYLADVRQRLERIRGDLVREEKPQELTAQAHLLQGSCGMVGATEMQAIAKDLEAALSCGRTRLELDELLRELAASCERLQDMLEARWQDGA